MARKQKPKSKSRERQGSKRPQREDQTPETPASPPPNTPALAQTSPWWHPVAIIFGLSLLLYGQTIFYDYALDDAIVITENDYTKQGFSGLSEIFTTDAFTGYFGKQKNLVSGGRYRPLSVATFAMEVGVFGQNPGLSHFVNVLLYGATGVALYFLMLLLFPPKFKRRYWLSRAFLISVIFMAHPIHTEVVANIKGRDEIMALLFIFMAMIGFIRYVDHKNMRDLVLASAAYFLALLSKETAFPFFVIVPLTIYFFRKAEFKSYAFVSGAMLLPLLLYFGIRLQYVGAPAAVETTEILNDPFIGASFGERLATVSHTLGLYLGKLVVPLNLSHDYYFNQIPIIGWGAMEAIVPLLIYLGLLGLGIWGLMKRNAVGFGILFYLLSLSLVSNIVLSIGTTMGERFVYVPSLGLIIAAVSLLHTWAEKRENVSQILVGALVVVSLLFTARTIIRNPAWQDNLTLFLTDVENSPNSAKVRTAAGGALVDGSDLETNTATKNQMLSDAIGHLEEAVKIYPGHGNAWLLLGNAHFKYNDNFAEALKCFQTSSRLRPGMLEPVQNAAVAAGKLKNYSLAEKYYARVTRLRPNEARYRYDRGINFENWQKADSALYAYHETIRIQPDHSDALGKIGLIHGKFKGNFAEAIKYGQQAMALSPDKEWLYENVGIAQAMSGDPQAAIATFKAGIQRLPNSGKLYKNLGITYINLGDSVSAQQNFDKARQFGVQ
ncbi:MAG: hypothetical protein AAF570_07125 [Bacteroidota bacterium]